MTNLHCKVSRLPMHTIISEAGGVFHSYWPVGDALYVNFEDAAQTPPRSTFTVPYWDIRTAPNPVAFVREHIERSRKKFEEAG